MKFKQLTYEFFKKELMLNNGYTSEEQLTDEDHQWIEESTDDYLDMLDVN